MRKWFYLHLGEIYHTQLNLSGNTITDKSKDLSKSRQNWPWRLTMAEPDAFGMQGKCFTTELNSLKIRFSFEELLGSLKCWFGFSLLTSFFLLKSCVYEQHRCYNLTMDSQMELQWQLTPQTTIFLNMICSIC